MTNSKHTKKALLMSILSMLLCCTMLIGSTFAWFTDSVTSGANKIVAGNLDVELYHTNGKVIDEKVVDDTQLFVNSEGASVQWEPGVMVYENFTVKNAGSLALKYKLTLNAECNTVNGKSLKDVLKVAVLNEAFNGDRAAARALTFTEIAGFEQTGKLAADEAGKTGNTYAVIIYWEPAANDNNYNLNNGATEQLYVNLGVNLIATQDTFESDGFDKNYDEGADKVINPPSPDEVAAEQGKVYRDAEGNYYDMPKNLISDFVGKNVTLIADFNQTSALQSNLANTTTVVDMNGHTYTGNMDVLYSEPNTHVNSSLTVKNGTWEGTQRDTNTFSTATGRDLQNVTFENMTFNNNSTKNTVYGVYLKAGLADSSFNVKDCKFNSNAKFEEIAQNSGTLTFENSTVTGRLWVSGVAATISNSTVEGVLKIGEHSSGKGVDRICNVTNSTLGGLNIVERTTADKAVVIIEHATVNGDITCNNGSMTNYDLTLIDTTVTGTLSGGNADKLHIISGTFGFDPTAYLVEGSTATDNGNGTWTVTAA